MKLYESTCCNKEIEQDEFLLNHSLCDSCMDKEVEESNKRQLETDGED